MSGMHSRGAVLMNTPARLHKEVNMSLSDKIEQFILDHAFFFLALATILLFALFITLCVVMCGASATDSGLQYNQLEKII